MSFPRLDAREQRFQHVRLRLAGKPGVPIGGQAGGGAAEDRNRVCSRRKCALLPEPAARRRGGLDVANEGFHSRPYRRGRGLAQRPDEPRDGLPGGV